MLKVVCRSCGDMLHHLPYQQIAFTDFLVLAQNEVFCIWSRFRNVLRVVLLQNPGCLGYLPASTDCT